MRWETWKCICILLEVLLRCPTILTTRVHDSARGEMAGDGIRSCSGWWPPSGLIKRPQIWTTHIKAIHQRNEIRWNIVHAIVLNSYKAPAVFAKHAFQLNFTVYQFRSTSNLITRALCELSFVIRRVSY